jgi:hypothetical protein
MTNDSCTEHWCEHYGSEQCNGCKKHETAKDKPDLRVILKRRADAQMELEKNSNKNQGHER